MGDTAETDLYPLKVDNACESLARFLKAHPGAPSAEHDVVASIVVSDTEVLTIRVTRTKWTPQEHAVAGLGKDAK